MKIPHLIALLGVTATMGAGIPKIEYVSTLRVNTDTSTRYATKKTLDEGIRDIQKLTKTFRIEEEWFYLPRQGLWIEVGRDERRHVEDDGFTSWATVMDPTGLESMLSGEDTLYDIHFHPDQDEYFRRTARGLAEAQSKEMPEDIIQALTDYTFATLQACNAMPSRGDLAKAIRTAVRNKDTTGTFYFGIVTDAGTIQYQVSKDITNRFTGVDDPKIDTFAKDVAAGLMRTVTLSGEADVTSTTTQSILRKMEGKHGHITIEYMPPR
ncbi:MAG: hypothetical protein ABIH41_04080 [Nanoarchaeota archaeon]